MSDFQKTSRQGANILKHEAQIIKRATWVAGAGIQNENSQQQLEKPRITQRFFILCQYILKTLTRVSISVVIYVSMLARQHTCCGLDNVQS